MVWTYVQPAGSQRSPCVERCMQAPARCACWLRSGPGLLVVQDRPPQSPPPQRTALLCSSSSGPEAASREGRWGDGGQTQEQRQGVETVTQNVATWSQQGGWEEEGWQAYACQRCGIRSVVAEEPLRSEGTGSNLLWHKQLMPSIKHLARLALVLCVTFNVQISPVFTFPCFQLHAVSLCKDRHGRHLQVLFLIIRWLFITYFLSLGHTGCHGRHVRACTPI